MAENPRDMTVIPGSRIVLQVLVVAMTLGGALFIGRAVVMDGQLGLALIGGLLIALLSWSVLIGLRWWRKYSSSIIALYLLSVLSGNVYLVSLGSVHLWLSFSDVFLIPALMVLLFEYWKRGPSGWTARIGLALGLFLTLAVFRGMLTEEPTRALAGAKAVGSGLLIFLLAARSSVDEAAIRRRLLPVVWVWGIGLLVMATGAVVAASRQTGLSLSTVILTKVPYLTPLGRSNYMASLALLLWPVSFYGTIVTESGTRKALGIIGTCALVLSLLVLYSRGALIAFAFTLPIVLLTAVVVLQRRRLRITVRQIAILLLLILLIAVILAGLPLQWMQSLAQQAWSLVTSPATWQDYQTAQARFLMWEDAWYEFMDNPLMGQGLYNVTQTSLSGVTLLVHNFPLQLLAETGIVGFLLYAMALALVVYRLRTIVRRYEDRTILALSAGVLLALLVALVHSLVEANFLTRDFDLLAWGLIGCVLSGARTIQEAKSSGRDRLEEL